MPSSAKTHLLSLPWMVEIVAALGHAKLVAVDAEDERRGAGRAGGRQGGAAGAGVARRLLGYGTVVPHMREISESRN